MEFSLLNILCLVIVLIAVVTDFYNRKIPNWLTVSAAVLAIVMQFRQYGTDGIVWAIAGWVVGVVLGVAGKFGPKLLRRKYGASAIGFGDVKLLGAVGAFLGPHKIAVVFFFFCIFFGLHSLIRLMTALPIKSLWVATTSGLPLDSILKKEQENISKALQSKIPLAPSIALATVVTMLCFDALIKIPN